MIEILKHDAASNEEQVQKQGDQLVRNFHAASSIY